MKILIIEDHYYFVKKLLDVFAPQHTTGESDLVQITATSEAEIAEDLLKKRWDYILIDHDLPHRASGWQLLNNTNEYRKADNALIIAISAVPENNKRLLAHGAHIAVAKMNVDFAETIKKIIEENANRN